MHPFRKKWGQNFLRDPNNIAKIVDLLEPKQTDTILEVGPGDGALTDELTNKAGHITCTGSGVAWQGSNEIVFVQL